MLNKLEIDINLMKNLYETDKKIAERWHFSKCNKPGCSGVYHQSNYPRKPRGIPPEAEEYFALRFSFCCSKCSLRFTCESVRFLGRRIYAAYFIATMLYPPAEEIQKELIQLPPQTLAIVTVQRWILWWDLIIPKSPVWKTLAGLILANVEKLFLLIFLMDLFIKEFFCFKKSLLNMLEFISPISIPANYPPSN